MAKTKFYHMWTPEGMPDKYHAWWSDRDIEGKTIICPVDEGHQRARRTSNLTVIIKDGKAFKYDIIWTWYSEPLINERVAKILKDEGLTGYELKPVTIKKVKKSVPETIPLLQELCAVGRAEVHEDTGLIVDERCDACKLVSYRGWKNKLIIDEEKWDGSDFFRLEYPGGLFVSERVKEVFEKHKVTGVEFTPAEECEDIWRTEKHEEEREKWGKYWDEMYSRLFPDLYPKLSREDKDLFRWDLTYTANETYHRLRACKSGKRRMKEKEIDEKIYEEMAKVVVRWEEGSADLFSWDDIPGEDEERLLSFLTVIVEDIHPVWLEWKIMDVGIKKIDDGETILVFARKKGEPYSLKLNRAEKKVTLRITDEIIKEYDLKEEGGKLKVYKRVNFAI